MVAGHICCTQALLAMARACAHRYWLMARPKFWCAALLLRLGAWARARARACAGVAGLPGTGARVTRAALVVGVGNMHCGPNLQCCWQVLTAPKYHCGPYFKAGTQSAGPLGVG